MIHSFEITKPIPEKDANEYLGLIRTSLTPCGKTCSVKYITRLRAGTISRDPGSDERSLATIISVYSEVCGRYPEDAVSTACEEWMLSKKFWPSVSELVNEMDLLTMRRRALSAALEKGYQPPEQEDEYHPTPEDKEYMLGLLREARKGRVKKNLSSKMELPQLTREIREKMMKQVAEFSARLAKIEGER